MITLTLNTEELKGLRAAWGGAMQRAEPRLNGAETPLWWLVLAGKLDRAEDSGSASATTVDSPVETVRPFEEIDVSTAAGRLGISEQAVRKRISSGTLPARKVGQRTWLVQWSKESDGD